MKGAGKIILVIAGISTLFLFYVHVQTALFRVSYLIDQQSDTQARLTDAYRHLKFEVEQLKAPRLLEEKMKQLSLDLTLPKEFRVVSVPVPVIPQEVVDAVAVKPLSNGWLQFLGRWVNVAQAKTDS